MSGGLAGFRAWLHQRVTAVLLAAGFLLLGIGWWRAAPLDHMAWNAWLGSGWARIGLPLFFGALLLHAWIGLRDVILDYIHPLGLRLALLALLAVYLLACLAWLLYLVWGA